MAEALFETYAADGRLQVSAKMMQHYLSAQGTITLNSTSYQDFINFSENATVFGSTVYNSTTNIPFNEDQFIAFSSNAPMFGSKGFPLSHTFGTIVKWFVFSPFSSFTPTSGTAKLALYDANGTLMFDSSARPLMYHSVVDLSTMTPGMDSVINLPAGRGHAILLNKPSMRMLFPFGGFQGQSCNCNETAFHFDASGHLHITESNRTAFSGASQLDGKVMIVDVSGF
jgi:hypothetical protein